MQPPRAPGARDASRWLRGLAITVVLAQVVAVPARAAPERLLLTALDFSADFSTSRIVFGLGMAPRDECQGGDCARLFVSRDAGATWESTRPPGWEGQRVLPVRHRDSTAVISRGAERVLASFDAGRSFAPLPSVRSGALAAAEDHEGEGQVLVVADGRASLLAGERLAAKSEVSVPRLGQAVVAIDSAGGFWMAGQREGAAASEVHRCRWASGCSAVKVPSAPAQALTGVFASASDRTVLLTYASGTMMLTDDDGRTWRPSVITASMGGVTTSITAVDFAPGRIVVGVFSVDPSSEHAGSRSGVYSSTDRGVTWQQLGRAAGEFGVTALDTAPNGALLAAFVDVPQGSAGVRCLATATLDGEWSDGGCPMASSPHTDLPEGGPSVQGGASAEAASERARAEAEARSARQHRTTRASRDSEPGDGEGHTATSPGAIIGVLAALAAGCVALGARRRRITRAVSEASGRRNSA